MPPPEIILFEGDGSLAGFFRVLKAALLATRYDVIHIHAPHAGLLFLMITWLQPKYRRQAVYTVQNSYFNYKFRNRLLLYPIFVFFRKLVLCSQASFESLPPLLKWLGQGKIHIVQNAVDVDRINRVVIRMPKTDRPSAAFTVASVGRIIEIKNPFTLLEAFDQSRTPNCTLVFVGEGNLRSPLMKKIDQIGLAAQVKTTGLIGRDEVFAYLATTDLFVSTSRGEGLPVAVLEAMACGCPVILSDIPPHREIAKGVDFIPLLKPDDVAGFAHHIKQFRDLPAQQRVEIGQKCSHLVKEKFGLATMHHALQNIYAQIVAKPELVTLALRLYE